MDRPRALTVVNPVTTEMRAWLTLESAVCSDTVSFSPY